MSIQKKGSNRTLAERAVNSSGWRWVPGMLTKSGLRILSVGEDWDGLFVGAIGTNTSKAHRGCADKCRPQDLDEPDLSDPATLGCLLALVREAWSDDQIYFGSSINSSHNSWSWVRRDGDERPLGRGATEAEALVAALEAASFR